MPKELAPLTNLERIACPLEAITGVSTIDELDQAVSNGLGIIAKMKDILKDCQEEFDMQVLQIIAERGPFQLRETKFVAGVKKSPKQAPPIDILNALSDATGGDFEKIVGCLASSAFKSGASKQILGKDSKLFWSVETDALKKTVLKKLNTHFIN
jgi:hypothetical protein